VQSGADGGRRLSVTFRADRIEHIKGFRVYLEDKNPEGKQCQHLILKDPRQLNFSYRNTKLSSQLFSSLTFDTDYMVRVVPFPTLMNESFFPPSFLRTN
ncbi:interleukin-17 receptor D-like isoform X2, partial [Lates japonicus]